MTVTEAPAGDAPAPEPFFTREEGRWTHQWKELYEEVITSGLCTGCAGCVIACPHDVLGYNDDEGVYKPFQLEDGFASTSHARLVPHGDVIVLEDLGSTNGTYLNGEPLSGPQPLHVGDKIRIGDSEFTFER